MNRKDKIINLFEFLMELIDEPETKVDKPTLSEIDHTNEGAGFMADNLKNHDETLIARAKELMDYTTQSDEKKYKDLGVQRIVQQTLKPILQQLQDNETQDKVNKMTDRTGVTFDTNGRLVEVEVGELKGVMSRNEPPVDEEANDDRPPTMEDALCVPSSGSVIPTDKGMKSPTIQVSGNITEKQT